METSNMLITTFLRDISLGTLLEVVSEVRMGGKIEDSPHYRFWYSKYKEDLGKKCIANLPVSTEVGNEDTKDQTELYEDLFKD